MTAYYNEIDPYAAQWLRNLIAEGIIASGVVDERSIEDVKPSEIADFTQCHFFAGVGVWSYALRMSGWPDNKPVWTGSCPCQPFGAAGAGAGFADPRHLWPSFAWLIKQCKPSIVFGEQVASKAVEPWVDLIHADLETLGYAFGAIPFPAAGVGAPHIRDRLFWVADSQGDGYERPGQLDESSGRNGASHLRAASGMGDSNHSGKHALLWPKQNDSIENLRGGKVSGSLGRMAEGHESKLSGLHGSSPGSAGPTNGFWRNADWLGCRDDKWRPVEPGTFPLAHGATSRVGRLRAYGNAINSEAAKVFIECLT